MPTGRRVRPGLERVEPDPRGRPPRNPRFHRRVHAVPVRPKCLSRWGTMETTTSKSISVSSSVPAASERRSNRNWVVAIGVLATVPYARAVGSRNTVRFARGRVRRAPRSAAPVMALIAAIPAAVARPVSRTAHPARALPCGHATRGDADAELADLEGWQATVRVMIHRSRSVRLTSVRSRLISH